MSYFLKLGGCRNFWGHDELKPVWWPEDIPFVCISNSKKNRITKRMLISIISSYQQCFDVKPPSKHFENLDILSTSTPKKRGISPCTGADVFYLVKRAKFRLEDSFSEPENTSYFGGILDNPSSNDINMLHINNKLTKRISA